MPTPMPLAISTSIGGVPTNNTMDVYRSGNTPPAAPDVAGVACLLTPDFVRGTEASEADPTERWTHVAVVSATTDIRDAWTGSGFTTQDTVYVPDRTGTAFLVVFVERVNAGGPGDSKRCYLRRQTPNWPTNNL